MDSVAPLRSQAFPINCGDPFKAVLTCLSSAPTQEHSNAFRNEMLKTFFQNFLAIIYESMFY